jgi:hypothetical protein
MIIRRGRHKFPRFGWRLPCVFPINGNFQAAIVLLCLERTAKAAHRTPALIACGPFEGGLEAGRWREFSDTTKGRAASRPGLFIYVSMALGIQNR